MKFNVWLEWMDSRLQYHNLKSNTYLNIVPAELSSKLWKPTLAFINNNEGQIVKYSKATSVMMLAGGAHAQEASFNQRNEAKVYNSNETTIWVMSSHFLKFKCDYDLQYIPFDHQTCYVEVKHMSTVPDVKVVCLTHHSRTP